jgi:hypothetical protein
MASETKTSGPEQAAETVEQFARAQEQAAQQWTNAQEQVIGIVREAQAAVARSLPSVTEVIEAGYDVAAQTLHVQRDLTVRWFEALTPRLPETVDQASGKKSSR